MNEDKNFKIVALKRNTIKIGNILCGKGVRSSDGEMVGFTLNVGDKE